LSARTFFTFLFFFLPVELDAWPKRYGKNFLAWPPSSEPQRSPPLFPAFISIYCNTAKLAWLRERKPNSDLCFTVLRKEIHSFPCLLLFFSLLMKDECR